MEAPPPLETAPSTSVAEGVGETGFEARQISMELQQIKRFERTWDAGSFYTYDPWEIAQGNDVEEVDDDPMELEMHWQMMEHLERTGGAASFYDPWEIAQGNDVEGVEEDAVELEMHWQQMEHFERTQGVASLAVVVSLPDFTFDASCPNSECAVCIEQFFDGESLKKLPCTHHFHATCILPWLRITNTCPLCRFQLPMAIDNRYT